MNIPAITSAHRLLRLGFFAIACLLASPAARAGLTFTVDFYRNNQSQNYAFYTPLFTNDIAPAAALGTYIISSPGWPTNGSQRAFDLTASGLSDRNELDGENFYSDFNSIFHDMTNGNWQVIFTNATTTNVYSFTVSAPGVSSNALPATIVTSPTDGEFVPANPITFAWQGPSSWAVNGSLLVNSGDYTFYQPTNLPAAQNTWTLPVPLGSNYTFSLNYVTNYTTPIITASTPLNTNTAQPISGWASSNIFETGSSVTFSVFTPGNTFSRGHTNVAFWTFDDDNLTTADVSGSGNDIQGYAWFSNPPYLTNDAVFGPYAAGFGGGCWLTPPTNLVAALEGSFSVSLWVRTTETAGSDFGSGDSGAGLFAANSDQVIPMALTGSKLAFLTGGSPANTLHSVTPINTGSYTHLVVTRDANTGQKIIYVNGSRDASDYGATGTLTTGSTPYLFIGENTSFAQDFVGDMDQIQIYTGVLTSNDVAYLYTHPGTNVANTSSEDVSSAALVAAYDFEDTNNPGADNSGHGNDANCGSGNGGSNYDTFTTNAASGSYARQYFGDTAICFSPGAQCFNTLTNTLAGSFSVTAWVATTNSVNDDDANAYFGSPILFAYTSDTNSVVPLSITGSKAAFTISDPSGNDTILHSTASVNDGTYHFLAVTRNQTNGLINLYVDGNLNATATGTTNLISLTSNIYLAGGYYVNYIGTLDDVRIYSGVLSASDITQLYGSPVFTFGGALNAPELAWTTSGDTPWFIETTNTYDGVAAQSGIVTNYQVSVLTATVTGPGTLTFYWSSQASGDFDYEFDIDGSWEDDIQYNTDWYQEVDWRTGLPYVIPSGPHTLTWTAYASDDNDPTEAGFLDQVSFVPSSPISLTSPQTTGADLQFAFQSQSDFNYAIEYTTNLLSGNWQTWSNFTGDGTLKTYPVPFSIFGPFTQGFIRVSTQ